jgi:hypothetical protein
VGDVISRPFAGGMLVVDGMKYGEETLGAPAMFLLPSLKLKQRSAEGITVEEQVHHFLMEQFGGYTAAAGNIFGYWVAPGGAQSYGEHRQFMVALEGEEKIRRLKEFLARIAGELKEQSILLQLGGTVMTISAGK